MPTPDRKKNADRKRSENPQEPPSPNRLPCPPHFDAIARQHWHETCDELAKLGLLHTADATALELYCQCYADYRTAAEEVRDKGKWIYSPDKQYPQVAPWTTEKNRCEESLRKYHTDFMKNPLSRKKLGIEPPKQAGRSKWKDIL